MKDQMMFDKKSKKVKLEKIKTADEFIKKWHIWFKGHEEEMRHDLISVVKHNKVRIRLNKTDLIGI